MDSYVLVHKFLKRYPFTIAWRVKQHCRIIDKHLNPGEKILYAFVGQKNDNPLDIVNTNVVALTNKRIMVGTKRVVFGYFFKSSFSTSLLNLLERRMVKRIEETEVRPT